MNPKIIKLSIALLLATCLIGFLYFKPAQKTYQETTDIETSTKSQHGCPEQPGTIAAAGSLGILIPPSVTMVVFASLTGESVGKLFIGGIFPGFDAVRNIYSLHLLCSGRLSATPKLFDNFINNSNIGVYCWIANGVIRNNLVSGCATAIYCAGNANSGADPPRHREILHMRDPRGSIQGGKRWNGRDCGNDAATGSC
jgi:hypothetical protein